MDIYNGYNKKCLCCNRFDIINKKRRNKLWCFCFCENYGEQQANYMLEMFGIDINKVTDI